LSEEIEGDFLVPGQNHSEENIDEVPGEVVPENTEGKNEPEEKSGPEKIVEDPGEVVPENTEGKKEKNLSNETPDDEIEGDFLVPKPEEIEEKTPPEGPPTFDIPTGRSRTQPENFDEENEEGPARSSGRKKSVHLEKVVNKTLLDILNDLKEIHDFSYQKEIKRTSMKIGENIIYLKEILNDNL